MKKDIISVSIINKSDLETITVKDKWDAIKAADLLESISIKVWSSKKTKDKFIESGGTTLNNGFLIKTEDGWRTQSNYIGFGISVEELSKYTRGIKLEKIKSKFPNGHYGEKI